MAVLSKIGPFPRLPHISIRLILVLVKKRYLNRRKFLLVTVYLISAIILLKKLNRELKRPIKIRTCEQNPKVDLSRSGRIFENNSSAKTFQKLLCIIFPKWKCEELRLLTRHTVFLLLRTVLSLYVADLDGRLVSSLVKGDGKTFVVLLLWWMIVAIPATFTNSMVRRSLKLSTLF